MTKAATYDAETMRLVIATVRYLKASGFVVSDGAPSPDILTGGGILVKNTEASAVPPWGCMQIDGTVDEEGRNYIKVKKPTTSGVAYLFNGPREIEASTGDCYGVAQPGPIVRAYKNTGTASYGERWAPTPSQWYLTEGAGQFLVVGEDDIDDDVFKIVSTAAQSGRLYRFTLNASLASGTADADILEMDGTDTTIDANVLDPLGIFASLVTVGDTGLCILQDGKYYVIQANCPA